MQKKNQHVIQVKEIRVRPNTGDHDLLTKMKKAQKFLIAGAKLKVTVMFRGREMHRMEDGLNMLKEVIEGLSDISKVERNGLLLSVIRKN